MRKTSGKNTKYSRNETIFKIGHLAKAIAHAKAKPLQNRQFGSKIKMAKKTCAKRLYKKTRVVLCKKPLKKKKSNIREMRRF